jgi:PTH1 family peptidyl-tRNA hydrolase
MRLIVGLGNPGSKYANTRHNAGFMAVDRIAERHSLGDARTRANAAAIEGRIGAHRVILLKPMTYMNLSGQAVGQVLRFHKLEPDQMLVLVDDTALPTGAIRLRPGGSSGGHNGLESIRQTLGGADYPRLRIGIGAPMIGQQKIPQADYVLGAFTDAEIAQLRPALNRAADAVETWLDEGLDAAMTRFNTKVSDEDPAQTEPGPRRPDF